MTKSPASTAPAGVKVPKLLIAVIAVVVLLVGGSIAGTALGAAGPKPTVKALGADVVKLSWNAVSKAVKYKVRYSTSSKMTSATSVGTQTSGPRVAAIQRKPTTTESAAALRAAMSTGSLVAALHPPARPYRPAAGNDEEECRPSMEIRRRRRSG